MGGCAAPWKPGLAFCAQHPCMAVRLLAAWNLEAPDGTGCVRLAQKLRQWLVFCVCLHVTAAVGANSGSSGTLWCIIECWNIILFLLSRHLCKGCSPDLPWLLRYIHPNGSPPFRSHLLTAGQSLCVVLWGYTAVSYTAGVGLVIWLWWYETKQGCKVSKKGAGIQQECFGAGCRLSFLCAMANRKPAQVMAFPLCIPPPPHPSLSFPNHLARKEKYNATVLCCLAGHIIQWLQKYFYWKKNKKQTKPTHNP